MNNKSYPALTYLPGFDIEITAKLLKQHFQRFLKARKAELTVDQWVIIKILYDENDLVQQELVRRSSKDAPTMTRILDLLVKKGLVQRAQSKDDRRKFLIHLTNSGKQKVEEVYSYYEEFRQRAYAGILKEEQQTLRTILNRIKENLS